MSSKINLTINGELKSYAAPLSLCDLLKCLELPETKIAIERNLEIVPKSLYAETHLVDGDKLEIVQFIGGG